MKYTLEFEFYGKYMSTIVDAENESMAKEIVKSRLHFHSITSGAKEQEPIDLNDYDAHFIGQSPDVQKLATMMGIKNPKFH